MGPVFFVGIGGLSLILSLFFQQGRGMTPTGAAIGLLPMAAGIVVSSVVAATFIGTLGRILIAIGLLITLAGVAGLAGIISSLGAGVSIWALVPPIFVLGLGLGT